MFREAGSSSGEAGLPEASCDIYFPTLNPWVPPLRLSTPRTPLIPHVSLCLGFVLWRRFLKHSHLPQVSLFFLQKASGEEDMQLASPGGLLGRCSAPLSNAQRPIPTSQILEKAEVFLSSSSTISPHYTRSRISHSTIYSSLE